MSAFSMGARIGSRRPGPKRMLSSTVAASAMPCSTIEMASRHSACCRRLATKPGTSFLQSMGCLPTRRSRSMVRSTTAGVDLLGAHHLDQRDQVGRVPEVRADDPLLVRRLLGDLRDAHHRGVGAEDRSPAGRRRRAARRRSCLRARSSNTHSTTTSAPSAAPIMSLVVQTRPTASSTPSAGNRPCSARKDEVRRERAGSALQGLRRTRPGARPRARRRRRPGPRPRPSCRRR